MEKLKVLLVDDHHMFLLGIQSIVSEDEMIEVVGEAYNGEEAYEKTKELRPDIVVMDLNMPVCDGLEALKRIKADMPEVRVIILTVNDREENLFEALRYGASGYLLKNILPQELNTFIHMVHRGESSLSGTMASKIFKYFCEHEEEMHYLGKAKDQKAIGVLTQREKEILQEVIHGATNREIAKNLFISENTVKNHIRNIMDKLHINNRVQVATYALQHGLLEHN